MTLAAVTKNDFRPKTAKQAERAFARKAALTSDLFDRLSVEAKQHAFRIAGVHKARLVQQARDVVHRAIRDGTSIHDVQIELLKLFATDGIAPPALYRLRYAFELNAHQAYCDGRREALDEPDNARVFPYRQYLTVGNGSPGVRGVRPTHAALHGLVFKWDDPFWNDHTPPWEHGCRCTFRGLTRKQVAKLGVKIRNDEYVKKRIRVRGQRKRGIQPNPQFVRGAFNLKGLDAEIRKLVEEMMKEG